MTDSGRVRELASGDDVASFDSGEASLDEYLRSRAWRNHRSGASRCFVVCENQRVVGYYALATASVGRVGLSGRAGRNMPDPVPAILLSRLAVDRSRQGTGLGAALLRDAIRRTMLIAQHVGVRLLLVHALDDAARLFYEHFDFEPSLTDELHLMLLLQDVPRS